MVVPVIDAVTSESNWNTPEVPPPLTVTPLFGPVIVSVPVVSQALYCPKPAGTNRLMVFSAEMLRQLVPLHPDADFLGGKPLPVSEFIRISSDAATDPGPRMQWLIDTPQRLRDYAEAAKARGITLRASLEVDVGLHVREQAHVATVAERHVRDHRPAIRAEGGPESLEQGDKNEYEWKDTGPATGVSYLRSAVRPAPCG